MPSLNIQQALESVPDDNYIELSQINPEIKIMKEETKTYKQDMKPDSNKLESPSFNLPKKTSNKKNVAESSTSSFFESMVGGTHNQKKDMISPNKK